MPALPPSCRDRVERLARHFATTAVARDRAGGHARDERELLRASGLLAASIPTTFGGEGLPWSGILAIVRRLAEVDSSLAHLFGFHHLQLASLQRFGSPAQQERYQRAAVRENLFWGNALSPLANEPDTILRSGELRLTALKRFCSGARGSDLLNVSIHQAGQPRRMAFIPTSRAGITVNEDWDNFGQRQTDSGSVRFENVLVHPDEILAHPPSPENPSSGLRNCLSQLILTNLYLGIGLGALSEGRHYTLENGRRSLPPGIAAIGEDPYVLHRYGELWLHLRAARAVTAEALTAFDAAWAEGPVLTATAHRELILAINEAKVLSARAGLAVSQQIFDSVGARATASVFGLDRFWRNVRTHTLHDPLDHKVRELGVWALRGELPDPFVLSS